MLTIYRRHLKECGHRSEGRDYRRCKCPVWVDGLLGGEDLRESLKTRDWQKASETIREWEARGEAPTPEREPMTIQAACDAALRDSLARGLRESTLAAQRFFFRRLTEFFAGRGMRYLSELDLEQVAAYRESWADSPLTASKKLHRFRGFFRFCQERNWITDNPARLLKSPRIPNNPTLPFHRDEMARILAACADYPNYNDHGKRAAVRALVLLLRYSGLRIGDAVTLGRERVRDGKLFLYAAKTGTPVWCPLPPFVVEALEAITGASRHFFWTGAGDRRSCVRDWQRALRRVFYLAGAPGGHPHQFRDTFAVELLLVGVPLERVSILLGHSSTKITERSYSPWIIARQEQLESDVRRTWATDLLALPETKGTPEVHGKTARPN